jgi:transcriptional regulator with XRE-family HTH domain
LDVEHRAPAHASLAELASASGINLRQVRRYESDEQQPAIGVALRLAGALGITIGELAGEASTIPQLAGDWWAAWQTYIAGEEMTTTQPVTIEQTGANLRIRATGLAEQANAGDYLWRGELRVWGDDTLMGWYAATDDNVRSKGTMFFILHTQGQYALGRWVGSSYDGPIVTGGAALARDHDELLRIVENRTHITERETP